MPIITGQDKIETARWLAVRSAFKIELLTGMRHSRQGSMRNLANEISGRNLSNKFASYDALNARIANVLGPDFDKPLHFFCSNHVPSYTRCRETHAPNAKCEKKGCKANANLLVETRESEWGLLK